MERLKLLQEIYARLSRLESDREVARLADHATGDIDAEMDSLRKKLQDVMNSQCPILKDEV